MEFAPAPSYRVFPTPDRPGDPYAAAVPAAGVTRELIRSWRPDACVSDILTTAPALAAECESVPVATLVPHIFPPGAPGFPVYSSGARLPRTRTGAAWWTWAADRIMSRSLEVGRSQYNAARGRLGLPPLPYVHTGLSRELTLVATLPGEPLYAALGFAVQERFTVRLPDGVELPLARMIRPVAG